MMTTCSAVRDRTDPKIMCCPGCGLFWETDDPTPPGCRAARHDDEPVIHGAAVRHGTPTRPVRTTTKNEFTRQA
jgi:hypothetical protein